MSKRKLCTLLTAFLLVTAVVEYHCSGFTVIGQREFYSSLLQDGERCLLQGKIIQKEEKKEQYLFYLKDCILQYQELKYQCNQILVYLDTDTYSIGKILCVKGKIKKFSVPTNEGSYHERQYYHSMNIEFAVEDAKVTGVYGKGSAVKEWIYNVKCHLKNSFANCMNTSDAGVMTAMTLGDKNFMDAEVKSMYQQAGISHFYSISGLHISMLGMAFYKLLRKGKLSYGVSGLLAGSWILLYGILAGFGISATRAIGMFLLLLYAKFRGRSYDRPTALALLAAIMVWNNPDVLHNAGFLLSFGAVAGVILAQYFMPEKEEFEEIEKKETEKYTGSVVRRCMEESIQNLKENFLVSLCIQLVTIPVLCCFFYEISVYAVFVNLFILPCMGVLFGCGLAGGAVGCFSVAGGRILLLPCHLVLMLFEKVCGIFLKFPNAVWITGVFSEWKLAIWYGMLGLLVFLWWLKDCQKSDNPKFAFFIQVIDRWRKIWITVIGIVFALCLLIGPQKKAKVNFLDVGQGDGIFIANGDGTNLFIDGGSSSVSKVGTYRILPFLKYHGVRKIDYWFVSHCDSDHISGLQEVMEADYQVKCLVVAKIIPRDEEWMSLLDLAKEKNIPILYMEQGQSLYGKDRKENIRWEMQCLFPVVGYKSADKNALSLALLYKNGDFEALFAGDLAEEQEKMLIEGGNLPQVDVFKVNHHGSKYSNSEDLLSVIQPKTAVISCGKDNSYGHPHAETIERLENVGSEIMKTTDCGQITVEMKDCGAALQNMLQ